MYAEEFNPLRYDRQARRKRKPKVHHKPKKSVTQIITEVADTTGIEGSFTTTYTPARHEEGWLYNSLRGFYEETLISDVLAMVKGGKEASVYRCAAHPSTGRAFVAAKVYRPRRFRNLSNDAMYREGRSLLGSDGKAIQERDHRTQRAVQNKSSFGQNVAHTSWLMHEFTTLQTLYQAGAAVPQPLATTDNAILMAYIGDAHQAAPTLQEIHLNPTEVQTLFAETMRQLVLLLEHGLIHGDLSAFNILYWAGQITLIDFPQVVDSQQNSVARKILARDVSRVCAYFNQYGLEHNAEAITEQLWQHYVAPSEAETAADESLWLWERDE
jgi:RIO kinase 1